jgi:hypothetical protein
VRFWEPDPDDTPDLSDIVETIQKLSAKGQFHTNPSLYAECLKILPRLVNTLGRSEATRNSAVVTTSAPTPSMLGTVPPQNYPLATQAFSLVTPQAYLPAVPQSYPPVAPQVYPPAAPQAYPVSATPTNATPALSDFFRGVPQA